MKGDDKEQMMPARALVEFIVEFSLPEIRSDPKRSTRKLVDMGVHFAKGHYQQQFFGLAQATLKDEASPYYTWVRNMVERIDPHTLKTFGINLGWESWTTGVNRIRAIESRQHFYVPWSITFYLGEQSGLAGIPAYRSIAREGKALGISTYIFIAPDENVDLSALLEVALQEPTSAFVFFVRPQAITPQSASRLAGCKNVAISLDSQTGGWEQSAKLLADQSCLYGIHHVYSCAADVQHIVSGEWLRETQLHAGAFATCMAQDSSPEQAASVYTYVQATRNNPEYPIMLLDYYADNLYVDQIISASPCFLGVTADAAHVQYVNNQGQLTAQLAPDVPLQAVLQQYYPKNN